MGRARDQLDEVRCPAASHVFDWWLAHVGTPVAFRDSVIDPCESASEAGLRYVSGAGPCIRRIPYRKSFRYMGLDGKPLRDERHLARIRSLVIPPAWTNV